MCDLPLPSTAGLEVGMTVSIHDDRTHGGSYETFATITSVDEDWVGLDHGIEADYSPSEEPCLTTVYPLDIGHGILRRRFDDNTGNGLHPGAGSTNALFEGCVGSGNKSGFFFCVRANHITVRGCTFTRNGSGISIGTRDCYNHVDTCAVEDNSGPGVLIRKSPASTEVHSCLVSDCKIAGNARREVGDRWRWSATPTIWSSPTTRWLDRLS